MDAYEPLRLRKRCIITCIVDFDTITLVQNVTLRVLTTLT